MSYLRGVVGGVVVVGFAAAALGEHVVWNPAAEFSTSNGNPNGVWSYGTMPVGFGAFELMQAHTSGPSSGWQATNSANIWRNDGAGSAYGVAPGQISLHPGSGTQPCVLRWTAPENVPATLQVTGRFFAGDGGDMLVRVMFAEISLAAGYESFDFSMAGLLPGDTIDFIVYGGYAYGNTPLELTISGEVSTCYADFNQDGGIDGSDVDAFFAAWEAGGAGADVNQDGGVDGPDVEMFFAQWEAGGC